MNARYYVPYLNRFLSADTIVPDPTNPQSFNRYSYVENRPVNFIDPTGHCKRPGECLVVGGEFSDPHYTADAIISVFPADDDPMAYTREKYGQHTDTWDEFFRTAVGFISEPIDWILTGREIISGEVSGDVAAGMMLLAALPGAQGSWGDEALDFVNGLCSFSAETVVMTKMGSFLLVKWNQIC